MNNHAKTVAPAQPLASPGAGSRGNSLNTARLLASSLGTLLPGVEVAADVYVRNGYRLLGIPACADRETVARETGRLRTMVQLSPAALQRFCIETGYDQDCPVADAVRCVGRLQDPRARLQCELFWPHLTNGVFASIKTGRRIASPEVAQAIEAAVLQKSGREAALLKHAAAIVYHNLALSGEIAFANGLAEWPEESWLRSLQWWNATLKDEAFWDYLRERAKQFDDPRMQPSDVDGVRTSLPKLLLSFNVLFARAYAGGVHGSACVDHLRVIQASDFPVSDLCETLITTVKQLTHARLEPLVQQAQRDLIDANSDRVTRNRFAQLSSPILEAALAIPLQLQDELKLGDELLALTEFDSLVNIFNQALNSRIDYSTDDRERCLLYYLLTVRRLLRMPQSAMLRNKLEAELLQTQKLLYPDCEVSGLDATQCYFSELDEADPDASLVFKVNKVTGREVTVNVEQGSAGVRVSFNRRRVLVPRSLRAKTHHSGRGFNNESLLQANDMAEALWSAPQTDATDPFAFGSQFETRTLLEILERGAQQPAQFQDHVQQGHLSTWFDYRGQSALAATIRACEQGKLSIPDLLRRLVQVAVVEVNALVAQTAADAVQQIQNAQTLQEQEAQGAILKRDAELLSFDERNASEKEQIAAKRQEIEAQFAGQMEQVNLQFDQTLGATRRNHEAIVARAEQNLAEVVAANKRLAGAVAMELPLAGFLGVAAGALGWWLTHGPALAGGGLVVGGGVGFAIGQFVRGRRSAKAKQEIENVRRQMDQAIQELTDANQQTLENLQAEKQRLIADDRSRLNAIESDRAKILHEAAQQTETIRRKHQQTVQSINDNTTRTTQSLQQRLLNRMQIKRESEQNNFGPYQTMKSQGYRDGEEPSSSEMTMTYSEEQEARTKLQFAMLLHRRL